MQITSKTLTRQQIADAIRPVTAAYGYNVLHESENISGTRTRLRVSVADSRGAGARRSGSGRRGPWACWHVFRDVLASIYAADPDATIRTGITTYRGVSGFLADFPGTAWHNAGSEVNPVPFSSLCDCTRSDDGPFIAAL